MLDIRAIRENPTLIKERLALRGPGSSELIDSVVVLDEKRRKLLHESESLKSERNRISKEIGILRSKGQDGTELTAKIKGHGDRIQELDHEIAAVEHSQRDLVLHLPNLPHASVPPGTKETENRVEHVEGKPAEFGFKPKPHWEIATERGFMDFGAATKVAGSGFLLYKGMGARLERGIINFLLDLHTEQHGYTEVSPPFLVRRECMEGTSQLPKFAEEAYRVEENPALYLIPTAEVPVTNIHREEILAQDLLPIKYCAYTPCFRREAGSAGKETRGMVRVHQFDKVELVHIVKPETSYEVLETLRGHAEKVLKLLGLHYRVLSLCAGEVGFGAAKCYDIEVWAPGMGMWLEVSSCSNFEDFQARRMNLRYKSHEGKNVFCHTLNGSGTALPRLVVALLETFQQADGTVAIPAPLQPYLSGKTVI
jgi:seryl-tRNA synthetase